MMPKTLSEAKSQIKSERQYLSILKNSISFVVKLETLNELKNFEILSFSANVKLTVPASNAESERAMSRLELIKAQRRACMSNKRFSDLAI